MPKTSSDTVWDCIIIGGGPAGYTAGIYAGRAAMRTLILAGYKSGGQLMITTDVEDYPGFPHGIKGPDLMKLWREQAARFVEKIEDVDVESVGLSKRPFKVVTSDKTYHAKTLIIATGASSKWLHVPNEPRFIGKGISSCAVCVTPDTPIVTNPDLKPITDVVIQERVLTHEGRFSPCLVNGSRQYQGEMVGIMPTHFPWEVRLTPEHEALACKRPARIYYNKFKAKRLADLAWSEQLSKKRFEPRWIPAAELRKGDYIFYPILKTTEDRKEIRISEVTGIPSNRGIVAPPKWSPTAHGVPDIVSIDGDMMRLFGYYLSEGSAGRQLDFYFSRDQLEYAKDVEQIVKRLFGLPTCVRRKGSVTIASVWSSVVAKFFKTLLGSHSHTKSLPHWALLLPRDKQIELVKGLWRGDGSVEPETLRYVTTSRKLAEQLKTILLRLSVIPAIHITQPQSHRLGGRQIVGRHEKYEFGVRGPWLVELTKLMSIRHPRTAALKRLKHYGWFHGGFVILPIRKVRRVYHKGSVFNLAVETDNSYTTPSLCLHNCDGWFFKGKQVAVVGGGDTALREALYLANIASGVTVFHRRDKLRAQPVLQQRAFANKKIKFVWNTVVEDVFGKDKLDGLKLKNLSTGKTSELKTDGLFVAIGHEPNTKFLPKELLDEKGYVKLGGQRGAASTAIPGIFVAGDVHDYTYMQAVTAAGFGCTAALDAHRFLESEGE